MDRAGSFASSFGSNLKSNDTVLTLTCDGKPFVTAQADVIIAWSKERPERLTCKWYGNAVAECMVPVPAEAAK